MSEELITIEPKKKSKRGGKREGAGRRRSLNNLKLKEAIARIEEHGMGTVSAERDGKLIKITRIEALLEVLFVEGFKGRNILAIKEYFDRQLGKSKESVDLTSKGKGIGKIDDEKIEKVMLAYAAKRSGKNNDVEESV